MNTLMWALIAVAVFPPLMCLAGIIIGWKFSEEIDSFIHVTGVMVRGIWKALKRNA